MGVILTGIDRDFILAVGNQSVTHSH